MVDGACVPRGHSRFHTGRLSPVLIISLASTNKITTQLATLTHKGAPSLAKDTAGGAVAGGLNGACSKAAARAGLWTRALGGQVCCVRRSSTAALLLRLIITAAGRRSESD